MLKTGVTMNKLASSLIVAAALSLASLDACAADWQDMGKVPSKFGPATLQIDGDSVVNYDLYTEFWARLSFHPQKIQGETMSSSLMHVDIACNIKKWRVIAMSAYELPEAKGKLLASSEDIGDWGAIQPDTMAQTLYFSIC